MQSIEMDEMHRTNQLTQYGNKRKYGYFQQQFCTVDPELHQSHQIDKREQDHIAVWQR